MKGIIYFERKRTEIRIRYLDQKIEPPLRAMKKRLIAANPEESEKIIIWLWKPYRINKRRNVYDFSQVHLWIKLLPRVFPEKLTLNEVQRLYWLEFQRANRPAPNTIFHRKFLITLFIKLFCRTKIAEEDKEVWAPIPERFPYFFDKKAYISNQGQIRWWQEMGSNEKSANKKYKRKLLPKDGYKYAATHVRNGTLCVYSADNPHTQLRKLMFETFNLAPTDKPSVMRKRLNNSEKQIIWDRIKSGQKNGLSISIQQLAFEFGVSVTTIYRLLKTKE